MPEMLAGTATGTADSLTLQNDLNFQNNLAANELERAAAQNELSAQANQIRADADLQAAQTAADWAQMAYQQRQKDQNSGGSYKPTLSASQAWAAYYDQGLRTQPVLEAMAYYYGITDATTDTLTTPSNTPSGANKVSGNSADLGGGLANAPVDDSIVQNKYYYIEGLNKYLRGDELLEALMNGTVKAFDDGSFRKA
jgi:hypothetical protein